MSKKYKFIALAIIVAALVAVLVWYLHHTNIPVLEPAGQVGERERQLMVIALLLAAVVVVPTFALTIFIIWKYRESNQRPKKYNPDWDHSRLFEGLWWAIPIVIISILSVVTWQSSHALDPYKALAASEKPLTVEVVALDWKWLFIYPRQNVASVNLVEFPVNTPVDFYITSDTVMNSFWVPQLGGQIYAMPGMSTELHLVANRTGSFNGWSANISGEGFADMTFTAKSVQLAGFTQWLQTAKKSPNKLTMAAYSQLAKPTEGYPVTHYSSAANNLYDDIIMKYMMPISGNSSSDSSSSHATSNQSSMPAMKGMY